MDTQLGNIDHLDFDTGAEEEKEPQKQHWRHPTDPAKWWCGEERKSTRKWITDGGARQVLPVDEVNCVGCLQAHIKLGPSWWWNVHRAWYQTRCDVGNHECGS